MNKQIVDITYRCANCETPVTKMCHSDNLKSIMLLCLDCHLIRLGKIRKGIK